MALMNVTILVSIARWRGDREASGDAGRSRKRSSSSSARRFASA